MIYETGIASTHLFYINSTTMKRIAIPAMMLLISYCNVTAQEKSTQPVTPSIQDRYAVASTPVKASAEAVSGLKEKFPDAPDAEIKWKKTASGNFFASFLAQSMPVEAHFDADGKWLKTKTAYQPGQLPDTIQSAIRAKYDFETVKKCTRIELNGIAPYYTIVLMEGALQKELLASENGILKEY
jgi:Putative beta-lactamase-inhibitor-like, PepSY-like